MNNTNKVILLVEDNPDDVFLTLRALKKNNITNEVVIARDGVEALEYLLGSGSQNGHCQEMPAITLLDLKLPRLNGLEVLKRIRADQRIKLMPVVVLTASCEDSDIIGSYTHGCNAYIRKPIDFERFCETIKQIEFFWLRLNEQPPLLSK